MTPDITTAQIRKIWITAKEKGISSELLHSIIFEITKKESVKELNIKEAGKVIERICGKRRARKRCEPSGYIAKMSHDQLKQISNMIVTIERLGKTYTIEAIADKVAQKKPDQLTRMDAVKVATACKEIINRLKKQNQSTHPL
ncbi:phage protein GemA/Gp16 family protein [Leptospira interrogans]|uniref:phage protein GemA/Gp16 family protein n=1 Tax=Leptospira interrogans TaxID=173 RepID=UPI0009D34FF4|nr:phage protein GemA/Gp16 family protein [Leptospira interrogans]OOB99542.1 DUF1018 domain-containing protein [Leptospira interrogans serovar Australis]